MCTGLPASSKSTWAKEYVHSRQNWVRICNDELRTLFFDRVFSRQDTPFVDIAREHLIRLAISEGKSIIVDNCNLHPKHLKNYSELAANNKYKFSVQDFTNIPVEECIRRDRLRPNKVTHRVILSMYNQFLKPAGQPDVKIEDLVIPDNPVQEVNVLVQDPNLGPCVICDLDGTLALFGTRRSPFDASTCHITDEVNKPVLDVIRLMKSVGHRIIFVSGRMKKDEVSTRQFLTEKCGLNENDYLLYMRENGDFRKDYLIKQEIYENNIRGNWYCDFIMDDRSQVVKQCWRKLGLTCFQVADGEF